MSSLSGINHKQFSYSNKNIGIQKNAYTAHNSTNTLQGVSFGATLSEHVRDKALSLGSAGTIGGAGADLALGGSGLGATTAIGGIAGLLGGIFKGFLDYWWEKEYNDQMRTYREQQKDRKRIEDVLRKARVEINQRNTDKPKPTYQAVDEILNYVKSNPCLVLDMKTLEDSGLFGFGLVAGYKEDKAALKKAFISPFINSVANKGSDQEVPNGVLLYGISGNGKSNMAKALCQQALGEKYDTNLYKISEDASNSILDQLSLIKIKAESEFKETGQRSIILIDDIDKIIKASERTSSRVKRFLSDCSKHGITVIATTKYPRNIDRENLNNFSVKTLIEPPSKEHIEAILKSVLVLIADNESINFSELAEYIQAKAEKAGASFSCKQIELIAREADDVIFSKDITLAAQEDILGAIDKFKPDITPKLLFNFKKDFEYIAGITYDEYLEKKKSGKDI